MLQNTSNYDAAYRRYCTCWLKVEELRQQNLISRHLLSLPWQWAKQYYARRAIQMLHAETKFPILSELGNPNIVVSLTSFPFRIPSLHLVIKSILKQNMLPAKIFVCLTKHEFPGGFDSLPSQLKQLVPHGVEIFFAEGNLRSHNKYFSAFQRFPGKIVITVDDDFLYPTDAISQLMRLHKLFPSAVCANRVRVITQKDGKFMPYPHWKRLVAEQDAESELYMAMGWTGVLYPPAIYNNTVLDSNTFLQIAPLADDLWLKAVQSSNHIKVAVAKGFFIHPIALASTQKINLSRLNEGQKKNDEQWLQLVEYFELTKKFNEPLP